MKSFIQVEQYVLTFVKVMKTNLGVVYINAGKQRVAMSLTLIVYNENLNMLRG